MAWVRLDIPCEPELADVVAALVFAETGRGASVVDHADTCLVQAWVHEDWAHEVSNRLRKRLECASPSFVRFAALMTETRIEDEDWSLGWRQHFTAFRVGRRIVVKPSWESWPPPDEPDVARPDDVVIELDPGGAFGTGTHASTQLALCALEQFVASGDAVVDVGCGSGILTLAALLLGARRVVAIDFDPAAVQCARRNVERQRFVDRVSFLVADGLKSLQSSWDVIVANITAESVVALGKEVLPRLSSSGRYIVSGFLASRLSEVRDSLEQIGLQAVKTEMLDEWAALTLTKPEGEPR